MSKPLVSVILTTCGRVPLLQQAIRSVLSQEGFGGADLELIVVCDGEWPERFYNKIVKEACAKSFHPVEIVYAGLLAGPDSGIKRLSLMINLGLDVAHGEFITYLCDDDIWLPGRLDRLFTMAQQGNDWMVDRVRWMRTDGVTVPHATIGNFMYAKPLETKHEDLIEALSGLGSNWICHDCVMHRSTKDRWPEIENHTPVDWRFWCSLWRRGLKPKVMIDVGAEAFYPGAWRAGMTIEQAVKARNIGGGEMAEVKTKRVRYAVNVSGKIECISTPNGRGLEIPPNGRVDINLVTTSSGEMFPGFMPEGSTMVPTMQPMAEPDFVKGLGRSFGTDFEVPKVGSLVDDKPAKKKKPFKVVKKAKPATESKHSKSKPSVSDLKNMFKTDIVKLLKKAGCLGASMSKTKPQLIDIYMDSQ